jgi:hypothetical protein
MTFGRRLRRRRRAALVRDILREWTPLLGMITGRSRREWDGMSDRARFAELDSRRSRTLVMR